MPQEQPKSIVDQLFEERGSQYGDIRDVCHLVGAFKQAMQEVYIQEPLTSTQEVCLDMVLQKMARVVTGTHFSRIDSGDDAANYSRFIADASRILCGQKPQVIGPYLSAEMRRKMDIDEANKGFDEMSAAAEQAVEMAKRHEAVETPEYSASREAVWSTIRNRMSRFMDDMRIPKAWTSTIWHQYKDFHRLAVIEELDEYQQATTDAERLDAVIDALLFACQHEFYTQQRLTEVDELLGTLHGLTNAPYAAIEAVFAANERKTVGPVAKRGNYPYDLQKPHGWVAPDLSTFVKERG